MPTSNDEFDFEAELAAAASEIDTSAQGHDATAACTELASAS